MFPDAAITQLLNVYFLARGSAPSLTLSPTLAYCRGLETGTVKVRDCSMCDGTGQEVLQIEPRIEVECSQCFGVGQPPVYVRPGPVQEGAPESEPRTPLRRSLDAFKRHDAASWAVLELVFGERGQWVQKTLGDSAVIALWPRIEPLASLILDREPYSDNRDEERLLRLDRLSESVTVGMELELHDLKCLAFELLDTALERLWNFDRGIERYTRAVARRKTWTEGIYGWRKQNKKRQKKSFRWKSTRQTSQRS